MRRNHIIRTHEELLEVYIRLGMTDYIEKERIMLNRVKAHYGQPIQLTLF